MQLIAQPNRWTCLPTAVAMATNSTLEQIFNFLGHDGSKIVRPELSEPYGRIGFHFREMADYCLHAGYQFTMLEKDPEFSPSGKPENKELLSRNFNLILKRTVSVLCGHYPYNHAVACDGRDIYDPGPTDARITPLTQDYIDNTEVIFVIKS